MPGAAEPQVGSVLAGGAGVRHDFLIVSWREATERHRRLRGRQSQLQNSHVEREATACSRQRQDRQSQLYDGCHIGREATACSGAASRSTVSTPQWDSRWEGSDRVLKAASRSTVSTPQRVLRNAYVPIDSSRGGCKGDIPIGMPRPRAHALGLIRPTAESYKSMAAPGFELTEIGSWGLKASWSGSHSPFRVRKTS